MNTVDRLCTEAVSLAEFARGYIAHLGEVLSAVDPQAIDRFGRELDEARHAGRTIFVAGNGGSAAIATTMANDLGFDIVKKAGTDMPFRIFALTDNTVLLSAIANDVGYENVFVSQMRIHFRPGDFLVLISSSGNSSNVIKAAEYAREAGGKVLGLLGFDGGRLKALCDIAVLVSTAPGEYGPVEDAHHIINHMLAHWFQVRLRGESREG